MSEIEPEFYWNSPDKALENNSSRVVEFPDSNNSPTGDISNHRLHTIGSPTESRENPEGVLMYGDFTKLGLELTKHFCTFFEEIYGFRPEINWGRSVKDFATLLENQSKENCIYAIESFLEDPPEWYQTKNVIQPWCIRKEFTRLMLRKTRPWR